MHPLEQAAARLKVAGRMTALTGAGVSAASGIPTFRGPGGLWRTYRPEDLATPEAFWRDPRLVWEWYDWRRTLIATCAPNAAHHALAAWAARDGFTRGAFTVEINLEATEASASVDLAIAIAAEDALPAIDSAWRRGRPA